MKNYFSILFLTFFLTNTAHADWELFPAFYDVSGVASNDVLNVRAGIGTSHPIINTLAPNERYVEIIKLSSNGRWGLIGFPDGSGWASMRFLVRQPNQGGATIPRPLSCGGNEPFWGIGFNQNSSVFSEPSAQPKPFSTIWEGTPNGMPAVSYGFKINAIISGASGHRMLNGCCSLERS